MLACKDGADPDVLLTLGVFAARKDFMRQWAQAKNCSHATGWAPGPLGPWAPVMPVAVVPPRPVAMSGRNPDS